MKSAGPRDLSRGDAAAAIESKPMSKVLLIDDDGELAEEIVAGLADQGFGRQTEPTVSRWRAH